MHGYSSSEEEDDPRRPTVAANRDSGKEDSKKHKRKAPPQTAINRVWKDFQNKRFTKALAVLPFDPVQPSASSGRPNDAIETGYERVVEECRRKVKKIVQDCKRVNMRYRDVGWDIDWDLKMDKGYCLNGLGKEEYDLSSSSASTRCPKAVKRVHEIFEKPTFLKNVNGADVVQGNVGNCWLMASLSALANVEGGIQRLCVEYNTKIGIYGFVFYRDGEWVYSIIDDKLYLKARSWDSVSLQREILKQVEDGEDAEKVYRKTYQTGSKALYFGQNKDQNETWVPLIEKAYAKAHGDYASTSGGWVGEGLEDCSGGVTTELLTSDILDTDEFWDNEVSKANKEFVFGCSTGLMDRGYGERDGICEAHAYVIMDTKTLKSGERLVKLRNPWGKNRLGLWTGKYSDGSKEWDPQVQEEIGHRFGSDSVFWIPYEDMLQKYQHIDRTRLFREPGWRCCQRFIGVDVPWKSRYNEKFHIKLTRDSPLVMVLSQLDDRYFVGLQGQYTFRLHFRLHEQGREDAEDYICRSNGNYLMYRSVAIEVPDMPAGNYTVFISVSAERDTSEPSVEDVVRRETKGRKENEKLAQVGLAYDLAHSKAHAHLQEVARQRKEKERLRSSKSRMAERRKMWERRHLNREANRKQNKKNEEKTKKRKEAKEAEKKAKEAEEAEKKAKEEAEKKAKEEAEEAERKAKEEAEKKAEEEKKGDEEKDDKKEGDEEKKDDGKNEEGEKKDEKSEDNKPEAKTEDADKPKDGEPEKTDEAKPEKADDKPESEKTEDVKTEAAKTDDKLESEKTNEVKAEATDKTEEFKADSKKTEDKPESEKADEAKVETAAEVKSETAEKTEEVKADTTEEVKAETIEEAKPESESAEKTEEVKADTTEEVKAETTEEAKPDSESAEAKAEDKSDEKTESTETEAKTDDAKAEEKSDEKTEEAKAEEKADVKTEDKSADVEAKTDDKSDEKADAKTEDKSADAETKTDDKSDEKADAKTEDKSADAEAKTDDKSDDKKPESSAEAEAKVDDAKTQDKSVQTDDKIDKSVQTEDDNKPAESSEAPTTNPTETPAENPTETPAEAPVEAPTEQPTEHSEEPAPCTCPNCINPPLPQEDSDGESSDSPVEDYEDLYSDDDFIRKPRLAPVLPISSRDMYDWDSDSDSDSDSEPPPDPWNAICVVGFRVYSHDEGLELRVVMEGGALSEDGMGSKGARDLDDAQECAGGAREGAAEGKAEGEGYKTIVSKGEDEEKTEPKTEEKAEEKTEEAKPEVKAEDKSEESKAEAEVKTEVKVEDEPKTDKPETEAKTEDKPEEVKVEETKSEEAKPEVKVEEAKVEETKSEDAKPEVKVEDKPEESKTEEPKVEEPKTEAQVKEDKPTPPKITTTTTTTDDENTPTPTPATADDDKRSNGTAGSADSYDLCSAGSTGTMTPEATPQTTPVHESREF